MDPVRQGLQQILDREWFEAHETLEVPWLAETGERKRFLQGLIQGAVALEHLRRGNPRGARGLWRKARTKLAGMEWVEGVGVGDWLRALERFFAEIQLDARVAAWAAGEVPELPPLPPEQAWPLPEVR